MAAPTPIAVPFFPVRAPTAIVTRPRSRPNKNTAAETETAVESVTRRSNDAMEAEDARRQRVINALYREYIDTHADSLGGEREGEQAYDYEHKRPKPARHRGSRQRPRDYR